MLSGHALIIDDRLTNIDILGVLLELEGLSYTAVERPHNVMEILNHLDKKPNVVFLDLEFPGGSGFAICRALKADSRLKGVPLVAYSAHTYTMKLTRSAGFDGFLGKPLNVANFPEQIRRILNHEPVWER